MSTRNLTMIVDRDYASNHELGFAQDPWNLGDKSYVNMYLHHDGYPEWQGVQLANWVHTNNRQDGSAMAAKLVHDHYYDSCFLYAHPENIDHQYTYVIWTGDGEDIWISCYDQYSSKCVFVLKPEKIISKYMKQDDPMDYTDFANGATRYTSGKADEVDYHSKRLIDILNGITD
tara:strand:- start:16907 stop:17428 length:522 start_codon:yes stop_codon:yes gene_type:complete